MLVQQITHQAMHQRSDRKFWLGFQIGLERDDPLFVAFKFVLIRQTAESFAGSAASATAAALFSRLNRNLNLQTGDVV